jgi:hypothetical protein
MPNDWLTDWLRWVGGVAAFQIYGKGRPEKVWRVINVYTTARRDPDSRWPLWAGTCTTWTAEIISVGWGFAREVLQEQMHEPASRSVPVTAAGGRVEDLLRRSAAGTPAFASASEVLAHECGHTWQAIRIGPAYLPLVGLVTLFGEGPHPWNHFENQASEQGQFGGLVNGSVRAELSPLLKPN